MKRYSAERGLKTLHEEGPECDDLCTRFYLASDVDARIAELLAALRRYGQHTSVCLGGMQRGCICGFDEISKSLMER